MVHLHRLRHQWNPQIPYNIWIFRFIISMLISYSSLHIFKVSSPLESHKTFISQTRTKQIQNVPRRPFRLSIHHVYISIKFIRNKSSIQLILPTSHTKFHICTFQCESRQFPRLITSTKFYQRMPPVRCALPRIIWWLGKSVQEFSHLNTLQIEPTL